MTAFTTEEINRAAALWAEKYSASQIGRRLGRTRNSIVGLASRNRERFPARKAGFHTSRKRRPIEKIEKAVVVARAKPKSAPVYPRPSTLGEAFAPLSGIKPVPLVARHGCAWPIHPSGDPLREKTSLYCNARKADGSAYCAAHREMAKGAGTRSERNAIRTARRMA